MAKHSRKHKGAVYLGSINLHWCNNCSSFLIGKTCSICGEMGKKVKLTPPGDVRPAFPADVSFFSDLIRKQFGINYEFNGQILINKVPATDRAYEILYDGQVCAHYRYNLQLGHIFMPRVELARALPRAVSSYIIADDGALESIASGASLLAPGVIEAGEGITPGMPVIVYSTTGDVASVGTARMSTSEIQQAERGAVLKNKYPAGKAKGQVKLSGNSNDPLGRKLLLAANSDELRKKRDTAIRFVKHTIEEHRTLPVIVAFSGGKDSLATLGILQDAGAQFKVLFNNTGLEFEETQEYVHDFIKKNNLEIIESRAGDAFQRGLEYFGPPGRDNRWCCKSCKLGPTTKTIMEYFPDGVLSFIGQRRYESESRASKGSVWENPWVPGQIGASPIQNWTALDVWLYIFSRGLEYNKLYEARMDRIGCYLCPASDMAELEEVRELEPKFLEFEAFLKDYARARGMNEDWVFSGIWRWKNPPDWIRDVWGTVEPKDRGARKLSFHSGNGFEDCQGNFVMEGAFSNDVDTEEIMRMAYAIGDANLNPETGVISILTKDSDIEIHPDGGVIVKADNSSTAKIVADQVAKITFKSLECVACGVCLGRCPTGALELRDGRVSIVEDVCQHCSLCLKGPCPIIDFVDRG